MKKDRTKNMKIFVCPNCQRTFSSMNYVTEHLKYCKPKIKGKIK